jgi:hypothetical protein
VPERRNLDAERTRSGGAFVQLGGFKHFVHNRDYLKKTVRIGFELDLKGLGLPHNRLADGLEDQAIIHAYQPNAASVEFSVAWSEEGLYVQQYRVGLNNSTEYRK